MCKKIIFIPFLAFHFVYIINVRTNVFLFSPLLRCFENFNQKRKRRILFCPELCQKKHTSRIILARECCVFTTLVTQTMVVLRCLSKVFLFNSGRVLCGKRVLSFTWVPHVSASSSISTMSTAQLFK